MAKLTKRTIDSLKTETREFIVFDDEVKGFGARVFPSGKMTYLVQYRAGGRTRRVKIGPHGVVTPDAARAKAKELLGAVATRWDGVTKKLHPVTGEEIPDSEAKVEIHKYVNPRPAVWPSADFVVGNPPFIGGKDLRELGDGYAEALWESRQYMPGGADFVTYWWDTAASLAAKKEIIRFGLISTNSITQTFSRRVISRHLDARKPVSIVFAIRITHG